MLATCKTALCYVWMGAPVWTWALLGVLLLINEWVSRSRALRAQSTVQSIGDALKKTPLYLVPLAHALIDMVATPVPPSLDGAEVVARADSSKR